MKTRTLVLALALTLAAGASVASIKYGHIEPTGPAQAALPAADAIARVVVTASRTQANEAPVARIVVTAKKPQAEPVARIVVMAPRIKA